VLSNSQIKSKSLDIDSQFCEKKNSNFLRIAHYSIRIVRNKLASDFKPFKRNKIVATSALELTKNCQNAHFWSVYS